MSSPWIFEGRPTAIGDEAAVTVLEGTSFCLSSHTGDVLRGRIAGLFVRDTRLLSRWEVAVDGAEVHGLTCAVEQPFAARFVGEVTFDDGTHVLVVRTRYVGDGMREDLELHNPGNRARSVELELRAEVDFADLFEVKEGVARSVPASPNEASVSALEFAGRSGRGARLSSDVPGTAMPPGGTGFLWQVRLEPRSVWRATIEVASTVDGTVVPLHHPRGSRIEASDVVRRRRQWQEQVPRLETEDADLADLLAQSVSDLAALRIFDPEAPDRPVVAAGSPWFMALFGRDSLITAHFLLPLDTRLATGTLEMLAAHQGREVHPDTEEQPGRILHELRFGPTGSSNGRAPASYYGTVDATPLFVFLAGELVRWAGPGALDDSLVRAADDALDWVDRFGDRDGDGFVEYARSTPNGLLHQGWKDSHDGISFADGRLAEPPVALCEVQGYVYAAMRARALIARAVDDPGTAGHWQARAAALREAFDRSFWLPEAGHFALGLDADKRPIDSLTSNVGHLLWSGIVKPARATHLAQHLASPALNTGWGVRTLATTSARYDPLSYHNGSVWPHDTAICAAGLARYGFVDQASRLATGLVDASVYFEHRLPELFAGYDRRAVPIPVPYPAACVPQAWAASASVSLLSTMLGLRAEPRGLRADAKLAARFLPLTLSDIRQRGRRHRVTVTAGGDTRVDVVDAG
jgi:glycogen debranching enzyme